MYIYTYIYLYTYICTHVYLRIYIHVYTFTSIGSFFVSSAPCSSLYLLCAVTAFNSPLSIGLSVKEQSAEKCVHTLCQRLQETFPAHVTVGAFMYVCVCGENVCARACVCVCVCVFTCVCVHAMRRTSNAHERNRTKVTGKGS